MTRMTKTPPRPAPPVRQTTAPGAGAALSLVAADGTPRARFPVAIRPILPLLRGLSAGSLTLTLPDGQTLHIRGSASGPRAEMRITRWRTLRRAALRGDVGLGEAYMDGDWDTPDLTAALHFFAASTMHTGAQFTPRGPSGWLLALGHALRANSMRTAPRNIAAHYDLGNAFYASWLDPTMTYSAALFSDPADDLETAQKAKYIALIEATGIGPQDHVLEIGCGWGGFACLAAQRTGCRVTAVTLSPSQAAYARDRVAAAGLSDAVQIVEQDYRAIRGQFDRIVSIEMIEAVGERYWPQYFGAVAELLRPGGTFGLQAITIRDDAFAEYRKTSDFLQTYIFPGGMLLPDDGMRGIAAAAGLHPGAPLRFGQDYARTLAIWRRRFDAAQAPITAQGFDRRFRRMWQFYLSACEAGFLSGLIDVSQTVFRRP